MKYNMRICKCGRIHMIPNEKIDKALEENKNFLLICGGCGKGTIIGADEEPDWDDPSKNCYMMYSSDFSPHEDRFIDTSLFTEGTDTEKSYSEIMYSHGIKVMMMTGQYATDYFDGRFSDRWYPDFYKIQRKDVTVKEIMEFIDNYNRDRTTVNMKRFIDSTPDDMLDVISCYYIKGFDWRGTKWQREENS